LSIALQSLANPFNGGIHYVTDLFKVPFLGNFTELENIPNVVHQYDQGIFDMGWELVMPNGTLIHARIDPKILPVLQRMDPSVASRPAELKSSGYPFNTIGFVGNHCTGTLVGPRHVLTCGHCIHNGQDFISNLDFTSSHKGEFSLVFEWERAYVTSGWYYNKNVDWDIGLIVLKESPKLGWVSYGYDIDLGGGLIINMNGYPPRDGVTPLPCEVNELTDKHLRHRCDTVIGSSGSAAYVNSYSNFAIQNTTRIIYGIQSNSITLQRMNFPFIWSIDEVTYNVAVRIDGQKFWQICSWVEDISVCPTANPIM